MSRAATGARKPAFALALSAALAATCASAGRPLVTEDAEVFPHRACQLEAAALRPRGGPTESWLQPACNPTGDLELAIGAAAVREDGRTRVAHDLLQAKYVPRSLAHHPWGIGLVVGTVRDRRDPELRRGPGDPYAIVPLSFALHEEDWRLHLNAGVQRQRAARRTIATWAAGSDVRLAAGTYFHAEIFRSEAGRPFYQLGFSHALREGVTLDAAFGSRVARSRDERWATVGLTLEAGGLLP